MKRIFDICTGCLGIFVLLPVIIVAVVAIRIDSSGSALFRQTRVGRGTVPFEILKLRTMDIAASKQGGYSTASDDPRITRVGRVLRKTSIDELPQLINVLKGEMSIVGPRPDTPAQQSNYSPEEWSKRHAVRPGITGLAQATIRSAATHEERTRLDLAYVENVSFLSDVKIIGLTLLQVIRKGGN